MMRYFDRFKSREHAEDRIPASTDDDLEIEVDSPRHTSASGAKARLRATAYLHLPSGVFARLDREEVRRLTSQRPFYACQVRCDFSARQAQILFVEHGQTYN